MISLIKRKKRWFSRPNIILMAAVLLILVGVIYAGNNIIFGGDDESAMEKQEIISEVKTKKIGSDSENVNTIEVSGLVKPETQVDVVALAGGTVTGINFEVGQTVVVNQFLAQLNNEQIFTNLNTSNLNVSNLQQGLNVIEQVTDEMVRQAELGVEKAQESVASAEIGLQTARDNYNNAVLLQDKRVIDTKNNAIVSYYSYSNNAKNALDQINYILKVDGNSQLPGIEETLGVLDSSSVTKAEQSYTVAKNSYNSLLSRSVSVNSIEIDMTVLIENLTLVKKAVDDLINVLDNTIANTNFTDTTLIAQKNNFFSIRNSVVNSQTAAQNSLHGLQNIGLTNKQELDVLENGVEAAQKQLDLALLAYENSKISLDNTLRSKDQQVIGARTNLNNAQGQMQLVNSQLTDLTVKAPVGGQITSKYIELGDELNIGNKIATISQTDLVKIEINLPSEDIYKIKLGSEVNIKNGLLGTITHIDPIADSITRKVKVEIIFDNSNKELIPETYVDVSINIDDIEETDKIFIPLNTVTVSQTETYVFINQDNKAKKTVVELGSIKGTEVEVVSGLNFSDELIVTGGRDLADGEPIKVINEIR